MEVDGRGTVAIFLHHLLHHLLHNLLPRGVHARITELRFFMLVFISDVSMCVF